MNEKETQPYNSNNHPNDRVDDAQKSTASEGERQEVSFRTDQNTSTSDNTQLSPESPVGTPITNDAAVVDSTAKPSPQRTAGLIVGVIIVLLALGVGYYLYTGGMTPFGGHGGNSVATVNGEEVPRSVLNENIDRAAGLAVEQGVDPNDPTVRSQIESQALTSVINTTLLIQAAREGDITVTDAQIDEQITLLESQYGGAEALGTAMQNVGIDSGSLREDIREQLLVDQYVRQSEEFTSISATEEEAIDAYQRVSSQNPDIPPFEEVAEQIQQQLIAQKQQLAVEEIISRLRAVATIDITF